MKIPRELNTVTKVSKTVALIMFIFLPIIAFIFGMRYQSMLVENNGAIPPITLSPSVMPPDCTADAKICPDGKTIVGRSGPRCEFEECPSGAKKNSFCGGISGKSCPAGYYCKYDGTYPDAGGTCIQEQAKVRYICPETEYVNCMPGPESNAGHNCSSAFLQWAQVNCPNFKGAVY